VPDYKLKWSGWTAFRSVFDSSLVESIPDLPPDSTHWWGPDTTFFASRLGKNTYTVVGGFNGNPEDPNAKYRDVAWDQEASVEQFREKYTVSRLSYPTPNSRIASTETLSP
jgi:salicylate hydroxylase